jgi:hypothetical protein
VVNAGGSQSVALGGVTSFGPPSGVTGLAQRHRRSSENKAQRKKHFDRITLKVFDFRESPHQIYQWFLYK